MSFSLACELSKKSIMDATIRLKDIGKKSRVKNEPLFDNGNIIEIEVVFLEQLENALEEYRGNGIK